MDSYDPHDREPDDETPDTPETPPDEPPPPHVQDPPPDQGTQGPYIVTANNSLKTEG
jgi:hypothetical protein